MLAGELIVGTDSRGRLLSISGEISPDLTVSARPAISAEGARPGLSGLHDGAGEGADVAPIGHFRSGGEHPIDVSSGKNGASQ